MRSGTVIALFSWHIGVSVLMGSSAGRVLLAISGGCRKPELLAELPTPLLLEKSRGRTAGAPTDLVERPLGMFGNERFWVCRRTL